MPSTSWKPPPPFSPSRLQHADLYNVYRESDGGRDQMNGENQASTFFMNFPSLQVMDTLYSSNGALQAECAFCGPVFCGYRRIVTGEKS
jgi:hypothetical protein